MISILEVLRRKERHFPRIDTYKNAKDNGGVKMKAELRRLPELYYKRRLILVRNLRFVYPFLLSELVVE